MYIFIVLLRLYFQSYGTSQNVFLLYSSTPTTSSVSILCSIHSQHFVFILKTFLKPIQSNYLEYVSPTKGSIHPQGKLSIPFTASDNHQQLLNQCCDFIAISMQCLGFVWLEFAKVLYMLSQLLTICESNCPVISFKTLIVAIHCMWLLQSVLLTPLPQVSQIFRV